MRKVRIGLGMVLCCLLLSMVPLSAEAGLININFKFTTDIPGQSLISYGYMKFEDNIELGVWNKISSLTGLDYEMVCIGHNGDYNLHGGEIVTGEGQWNGNLKINEISNKNYTVSFLETSNQALFMIDSSQHQYFEDFTFYSSGRFDVLSSSRYEIRGDWTSSVWFGAPVSTPIPAAAWLLGSGLVGLVGVRRKLQK